MERHSNRLERSEGQSIAITLTGFERFFFNPSEMKTRSWSLNGAGTTLASLMRLVFEARITSIKVSDDSVILVGCLIVWVKLKMEQKFVTAWNPRSWGFRDMWVWGVWKWKKIKDFPASKRDKGRNSVKHYLTGKKVVLFSNFFTTPSPYFAHIEILIWGIARSTGHYQKALRAILTRGEGWLRFR